MARSSLPYRGGESDDPVMTEADDKRVRAVLVLGGVPFDELDDALQQVRLKLLQTRSGAATAEIRETSAWLAVVASRVAADRHRSRKREANLRERLAARWSRTPAGPSEDDRVLALSVADGLHALPARQRQLLTLRYYADLPVRDIARLLEVPEGTVKSRLHAAVAALRSRLREAEVIR